MKRLCYLDNVKVFLTFLVIFHHVGQAFRVESYWPYQPSDPTQYMPWIWHFFSTNASFFMSLFFLISGYFVPGSYERQGAARFVGKKLLRLGVPCVVMMAILSLMVGKVEIGHMWFVENLLVFCLLYALVRVFYTPGSCEVDKCKGLSVVSLLGIAIVMGVGTQVIRMFFPQDKWIDFLSCIFFEPARYLEYTMMFVLGILSCRYQLLEKIDRRTGATALVVGALLALGNYLRGEGPWGAFVDRWFGIYESLMCVSICFGLLWLFRECFNKINGFLKWCSAQSFGVYVFHLPILIVIQYMTDPVKMPPFWKFWFVGIITTVFVFVFTWAFRLIPGVKKVL